MADAETLLMETSEQNGNEDENGAEAMVDDQDNGTDGGKIDASKTEEDAGSVSALYHLYLLRKGFCGTWTFFRSELKICYCPNLSFSASRLYSLILQSTVFLQSET